MLYDKLDTVITINLMRNKGFCVKGTKQYAESLGLDFKRVLAGGYTVRDVIHLKNDALFGSVIKEILGE